MLKEINCSKFIEPKIKFKKGLNAVLGDNISSNSIGKSTFLMILDFIFGGKTFITKDSESVKHMGELTFNFAFKFENKTSYFSRDTSDPDTVTVCDKNYNGLNEISIKDFTILLKEGYNIQNKYISFRDAVSLYSRVWGKENYSVDKPLLSFPREPDSDSISRLIKLFGLFGEIDETYKKLKDKKESRKFLNGAIRKKYIPQITKTTYKQNKEELVVLDKEINNIKENILKFTLNIEQLTNKEVIELKTEKNKLLKQQSALLNKISRIDQNLNKKNIKSKHLQRLSAFFENPNEEKIMEIESFHNKLSSILSRELKATKQLLIEENELFVGEIEKIDLKISSILKNVSSPKYIVDKIHELTIKSNQLKNENKFYEEKNEIKEKVKETELEFDSLVENILTEIETKINTELISINERIHSKEKKIPRIHLRQKSYTYDHSSNTGTGKSYADLIEFDLAILELTSLPFIIHDSILFKNIEDVAMDKIIEQYSNFNDQIFISIDGIDKFNNKSIEILSTSKILELSKGRKLFDKDWS